MADAHARWYSHKAVDMVGLDISFEEHNVGMPLPYLIELRGEILCYTRDKNLTPEARYPDHMVLGVVDDMCLPEIFHRVIIARKRGQRRCPLSTALRPWF